MLKRRTVGILGGNGPLATAKLHERFILLSHELGACEDRDYPDFYILNQPISMNEKAYPELDWLEVKQQLIASSQKLEAIGADVLIVLCNSLHFLYSDIKASVKIPVVNMIEEALAATEGLSVGLVSSAVTRELGLYQTPHRELILSSDQEQLDSCIYSVMRGEEAMAAAKLQASCEELILKGAESIIIGCTELSVLSPKLELEVPIIDSAELALSTVLDQFMWSENASS
jgi:aspartate racemase